MGSIFSKTVLLIVLKLLEYSGWLDSKIIKRNKKRFTSKYHSQLILFKEYFILYILYKIYNLYIN